MKPALADRLSRAVVGCYPRRWKQRYAAELLDVLDQHQAGPRTVVSLAGGALSTHLDPDYRMQIRLKPHLSRDAKLYIAIFAAIIFGLPALVILPMVPRAIRESRWEPSSSDSVDAIAFSRDRRILVSATSGPPWEASSTLWDVTDQARPRRLSVFEGGSPATISPDGATVAANAFGGRAQAALWNVTRPVRVTTRPGILASARFPGGGDAPASPCGPGPGCSVPAAYAVGFTPDGRALTVVVDRPETYPSTAARDTVFTWQVGRLGCPQRPHHHLPRRQRRPADPGPGRPHRGRRFPHRRRGTPVDPALTCPAARTGP